VINEGLVGSVEPVDVLEVLDKHDDEYLYFRTDHHWTARGAYWAYTAFARQANVEVVALETMKKLPEHRFHGSLYGITRATELKEDGDTLELWSPRTQYESAVLFPGAQNMRKGGSFIQSRHKNYFAFLGGDFPMSTAKTSVKNGRSVILIKNSFGNAFAPYLLNSFESVVVVDYRHFKGDLARIAEEFKATDIVIQNVSLTATSGYHLRLLRKVLKPLMSKVRAERKSLGH